MQVPSHNDSPTSTANDIQKRSEILDKCLQALESKQATLESCVQRYPEFAELGDLLRAAAAVQKVQPASLSLLSKNEMRQQMIAHFRSKKAPRTLRSTPRQAQWLRPVAVLCGLILIIFLGSFGLINVSAAALPGDGLYPLKRFAEEVQLALTPAESRAEMFERLAETRLSEVSAMADENRAVSVAILSETSAAVSAALAAQPDLASRERLQSVTEQVVQKVQASRATDNAAAAAILSSIRGGVPPPEAATTVPGIANIIGTQAATELATKPATEAATGASSPTETSTVSSTVGISATEGANEAATPAATESTVESDTPVPTATQSFMDTPQASPTPKPRPTRKFTQPAAQSNGNANSNGGNSNSNNGNGGSGNGNGNGGGGKK